MLDDTIEAYVRGATSEGYAEEWDLDQLWASLKQLYPVGMTVDELIEESGGEKINLDPEFMLAQLTEDIHTAYARREEILGTEPMRELERQVLLAVIDRKWREHLYEMDYLQEGVGLRAYAQRDPLVEYQREGFDMFNQMMEGIKEEAVGFLFNLEVQVEQAPAEPVAAPAGLSVPHPESSVEIKAKGLGGSSQPRNLSYTSPVEGGGTKIEQAPALGLGGGNGSAQGRKPSPRGGAKAAPNPSGQAVAAASRNAPCPCGSGKKYKRCHGAGTN
jgi:preprotein translocase subunit SecA